MYSSLCAWEASIWNRYVSDHKERVPERRALLSKAETSRGPALATHPHLRSPAIFTVAEDQEGVREAARLVEGRVIQLPNLRREGIAANGIDRY